jgi:hypothetical protein
LPAWRQLRNAPFPHLTFTNIAVSHRFFQAILMRLRSVLEEIEKKLTRVGCDGWQGIE